MSRRLSVWGIKDLNTSAQFVLAKRLGLFNAHNLDVQCTLFSSEEKFNTRFEKARQKPFAWSQTVPQLLRLRAKGFPIKIISPLAEISASYQMVLRTDSGIILPGDLEGRTIGIARGSLSEIAFRNMAKDFDLDLSTVSLLDASPVRQLELFANGDIDALACWEPWTSQACYMGGQVFFSGLYSSIPGHEGPVNWLTGQSMLVTFTEHIDKDFELLVLLVKAVQQATTYLNTTLRRAASVFSDLLETELDELVVLLQKNIYTMQMKDLFQIGIISALELSCLRNEPPCVSERAAPSSPPVARDLYDSRILAQAAPSCVPQPTGHPRQTQRENVEVIAVADNTLFYPAGSTIQASGETLLRYIIVDDTQVVIDMFSEIVEMVGGLVVGSASTGAEAVVSYIDMLPDVVVIDISMPDMNGIEAIKHILGINPAANIIVISGNNYEEIRQEVFQLGVKLFIGKPFHIDQVINALQTILPSS